MTNIIKKVIKNWTAYEIFGTAWANINSATATTAWVVKLWSNTSQSVAANSPSSATWKTYPIQTNWSWQMVVNVPWENTQAVSSVNWQTWAVTVQDTLESGTNIKTVNNESILGSWNIAISWWHDYSWNTLTGTSFTLSWTNYRNLISTSSDTTVSVWTDLTPWMEYIIRITNTDSDNDHTMTFNWVEYIIPKSWTVTYKWLALTATTVEFEWPRYVYSMPATPEEWFIYYVLPEPEHPRTPWENTLAYRPLTDDFNDYSWNSYNLTSNSVNLITLSWIKCADLNSSYCSISNSNLLITTLPYTISFYFKSKTAWWTNAIWIWWTETGSWWWSWTWVLNNKIQTRYWNATNQMSEISRTQDTNWHNIVITYSSSGCYIYIDWTQAANPKQSLINPTNNINPFYIWHDWWNTTYGNSYVGSVILENKAWSASDVADYFSKTKANYWL